MILISKKKKDKNVEIEPQRSDSNKIKESHCFLLYSSPIESVVMDLKEKENELFSLGWLRRFLREQVGEWLKVEDSGELPYSVFYNHRVTWSFLSQCGSQREEICGLIELVTREDNLRKKLEAEREQVLRELSRFSYVNLLTLLKSDNKKESWQQFEKKIGSLSYDESTDNAGLDRFFRLVDRISILTDFLNGRSKEWGISVNIYDYDTPLKPLSHEIIVQSLKECKDLFKHDYYWSAIYAILKKHHSEFEYEGKRITSTYPSFVDYINKVREELPELRDCEESNLRKSFDAKKLNENIEQWDDDLKPLGKKFKTAIYQNRQ